MNHSSGLSIRWPGKDKNSRYRPDACARVPPLLAFKEIYPDGRSDRETL